MMIVSVSSFFDVRTCVYFQCNGRDIYTYFDEDTIYNDAVKFDLSDRFHCSISLNGTANHFDQNIFLFFISSYILWLICV